MLAELDDKVWRRVMDLAADRVPKESDTEGRDTYAFHYLYGRDGGFYRFTKDNKSKWTRDDNGELVYTRYRMFPREWIEQHVRIRDQYQNIVPLKANQAQRYLLAHVMRLMRRGLPVRVIILKARQMGFSTYVQGFMWYLVCTVPNFRSLLIAHRKPTSQEIFRKIHLMRRNMPKPEVAGADAKWELKLPHKSRSEVAIDAPMESAIDIDSAEVDEPGHGMTIDGLHMTETSRWRDADVKAKGLEQTIQDMQGTFIFDESTANGDVGYFHQKFQRGWTGDTEEGSGGPEGGWLSLFFPWFWHQPYRYTRLRNLDKLPEKVEQHIRATLTEEEEWLLKQTYLLRGTGMVNVDIDQLAWRRYVKREKCEDNWDTFNEQYPGKPDDAFLATGRPAFDRHKLKEIRKSYQAEEVWRGEVLEDPTTAEAEVDDEVLL